MLGDLVEIAAELVNDAFDHSSMNSGGTPSAGPTGTGAAGSGGAGGAGGSGGDPGDPGGDRDDPRGDRPRSDDERPDHERPDHERRMQRDNVRDTVRDLLGEILTSPTGQLGKVLGPLGTVASGSEVLADGVSTVRDAQQRQSDTIDEQTGDFFRDQVRDGGSSGSQDGPSERESSRGNDRTPREEWPQDAQDTMADIEFREQARQHAKQQEYSRWSR